VVQVPQMPPPPVSTRPSGSKVAVEWYCRTRLAPASTVQASVAGSHRSAAKTGFCRSTNPFAEELCPPVASTLPSARMVRFACRRPTDMEFVERTVVPEPLTSTTEAVFVGTVDCPSSVTLPPPTTRTLPMS
jgi:hypothetical protein